MSPPRQNSKTLPIDLMIEIFSRLPVKDIARCRCVSKLWSSILRRRDFTKLFLKISSTRPRLLFMVRQNGMRFFCSLPQTSDPDRTYSSPLSPSYQTVFPLDWRSYKEICAPVHGLICSDGRKPMICNPSTGEYITLPRVTTNRAEIKPYFVYEPIEKVFKVMCMSRDDSCRVSTLGSLGTGEVSRRSVKCSIPHQPLHTEICIDGVLYYLAKCIGKEVSKPYMLVCFDFRLEKFKFVAVEDQFWGSALINWKGKVGILWTNMGGLVLACTKYFELRVLEDADELKWSKIVFTLPYYWRNLVAEDTNLCIVGMTSEGVILLSTWYIGDPFYIFYYNIVKNTVERVEIQFRNVALHSEVRTFIDHVENVELMD